MTGTNAKYSKHSSRAAKAKRRIMQSAGRLFAERGYGNVGINEVGQNAGFGKGALYYHIRSKEDLLVSIVSECFESLNSESAAAVRSAETFVQGVRALTQTFVMTMQDQTDAMVLSYRDVHAITDTENRNLVDRLNADYRQIWADALSPGPEAGAYRAATDLEVEIFVGMLFASVLWAFAKEREFDALSDTFSDTILGALDT